MKQFNLVLILIMCLLNSCDAQHNDLQEIIIDDNTIIKNDKGEKIDMEAFMTKISSGDWIDEPVLDKNGKLSYLQLRRTTAEEKKQMLSEMQMMPESNMVGKKAPDFKLTDINGNELSSKNAIGKIIVLNFWFTSCKPCIQELPELNEVYEKYKNNPEVVFGSVTFDKKETVNKFLKKYAISYPVFTDVNDLITKDFEVNSYPTNIIIDKSGAYSQYIVGGIDGIGAMIRQAIEDELNPVLTK